MGQAIKAMGYSIELVDARNAERSVAKQAAWKAPVPENAPRFFRDAFEAARKRRRPIIVDFWANWCGPCKQLKNVTFTDETVKPLLEQCEVIYVDLDENPELGEFYGVTVVPDVFLIDRDGMVVDRFQNFEPPERFRQRVLALLSPGSDGAHTSKPSRNVGEATRP